MSIAKHVQSSTEKAAQLYCVRASRIPLQLLALPWGHRPTPAPCTTMGTLTHLSSLHYHGDTDPPQLLALPWEHRPTPAPCTTMGTQTHPSSLHYHGDTDPPQLLALPWGHRPTPAPCTTMGTQTHPSSLHYHGDTDPPQLLALPWGHRPTPAPCTTMGTQTHPSSLHYHGDTNPPQLLALCVIGLVLPLISTLTATLAESHPSNKTLEFSGDVTDRSKAAGLPFGTSWIQLDESGCVMDETASCLHLNIPATCLS